MSMALVDRSPKARSRDTAVPVLLRYRNMEREDSKRKKAPLRYWSMEREDNKLGKRSRCSSGGRDRA